MWLVKSLVSLTGATQTHTKPGTGLETAGQGGWVSEGSEGGFTIPTPRDPKDIIAITTRIITLVPTMNPSVPIPIAHHHICTGFEDPMQ